MCGTIYRTSYNKTTKEHLLKFHKVMAVTTIIYGAVNWTMNRSARGLIGTAEMKFLRYVASFTLNDNISSNTIRLYLKIFNVNEKIQTYKRNWNDCI